jgi:hypothetical protein
MYKAEQLTLNINRPSTFVLRRKASLPFVIMALPVWLTLRTPSWSLFYWHMRWLYRLGDFIGWIDDILDCPADAAAGHPNRVHMDQIPDPAILTHTIARQGKRVVTEWEHRVSAEQAKSINIFYTVVTSWLGGAAPTAG